MAKKKKSKPKVSDKKGKSTVLIIAGSISVAVILLLFLGINFLSGSGDKKSESYQQDGTNSANQLSAIKVDKKGKSFSLQEGEIRSVLDPSLFTGQVRAAYAAAKKYPEVLNEVFCYCFCDAPPFNHKTLLSCFTDKHGAG